MYCFGCLLMLFTSHMGLVSLLWALPSQCHQIFGKKKRQESAGNHNCWTPKEAKTFTKRWDARHWKYKERMWEGEASKKKKGRWNDGGEEMFIFQRLQRLIFILFNGFECDSWLEVNFFQRLIYSRLSFTFLLQFFFSIHGFSFFNLSPLFL